jgi:hypothetical protein
VKVIEITTVPEGLQGLCKNIVIAEFDVVEIRHDSA